MNVPEMGMWGWSSGLFPDTKYLKKLARILEGPRAGRYIGDNRGTAESNVWSWLGPGHLPVPEDPPIVPVPVSRPYPYGLVVESDRIP